MLTRALYIRLLILLAFIAAIRTALARGLTKGILSPNSVSFLTLLFIAAVLCAEGIILWKAAHQYYLKPIEYKDRWDFAGLAPSKASVRTTWAGLGLFLFALPFAFWETRLEPDTVLATLVGCAVNLLFVSTIIHTLVSFKRHARMASQRRTEQPTS